MLRSFNALYSLIIQATIAGFSLVFTCLCLVLVYITTENILWFIPAFILAAIISILIGSYLYVVLTIPFQLPQKFDTLKNKLAMGQYAGMHDFQEDIADFMLSFFNFFGAEIIGGKFHFKGCSEATIKLCEVIFENLNENSFKNNTTKINSNYKAFHLPIQLGTEKLGYIIVITKGYTLPIFYSVLQDFENYYLDDQIKHILK